MEVVEVTPRASIDTVIGELPPSPKDQGNIGQQIQDQAAAPRNRVRIDLDHPRLGETFRPLRSESLPHEERVEWEHIRAQLGLSAAEEGRMDWGRFRNQLGLADDDESSVTLVKQIGQAFLVLLTSPFMLLHGAFKMTGALCKCLGTMFCALAVLFKKLTYKPKKNKKSENRQYMEYGKCAVVSPLEGY
jgi:hypothetical protein